MKHAIALASVLASIGCSSAAGPSAPPPVDDAGAGDSAARDANQDPPSALPEARLAEIVEALREESGAPGVIVGVSLRGRHRSLAAGLDDVARHVPMRPDLRFRIGSVTKVFTGVALLQLAEEGKLATSDVLSRWTPDFPQASQTTLDMLLSHTGGVTAVWFEDPAFLGEVTRDLGRIFRPADVITRLRALPPAGRPGGAMLYSNAGFVLAGEAAAQADGKDIADLVRARVIARANLAATAYTFEPPAGLAHGYFSYQGLELDTADVDQRSIVSTAGAAGAMTSTVDDLTRLLDELFRTDHLVGPASRRLMMTEAMPGSSYGRALMMFCPCNGEGPTRTHAGYGHGGNLPGVWSVAVHYPAKELSVAIMINHDHVAGVPLGRTSLDHAAQAIFDAVP